MNSTSKIALNASKSLVTAASSGMISSATQKVIEDHLDDISLSGCQGIDIDDIDSEEVTLVSVIIDASGSMYDHRDAVIKAYREFFLQPLKKAKNAESILASLWIFSKGGSSSTRLIHGYTPIPQCPELTENEYSPDGSTPLYDAVMNGLTGIITYGQSLRDNGTRTKSIVVVISDGEENCSQISGAKVRRVSQDVLRAQEFVLSYVFFGDEKDGDKIAQEIGFPPRHRLTDKLGDSGIRRVFGQVSASVITTSQSMVSAGANPFFSNP